MPLSSPLPSRDALRRLDRRVVPSGMTTAEWEALGAEVTERAFFSATNLLAGPLEELLGDLRDLVNPRTEMREGQPVTVGPDRATVRLRMKENLRKYGYAPEEDKAGTIQDLSSDARINLVIDHNVTEANAYGHHLQALDEDFADAFPAQELVRFEDRKERRNWHEVWRAHGGTIYPGAGLDGREGRLIARKDDPIWSAISRFGHPWPPFDFGSGVGLRDVTREEAVALGVIGQAARIATVRRAFNDQRLAA
jgi:hypothetical protein